MAINWTEARIEEVVAEVIKSLGGAPEKKVGWDSTQYNGRKFIGVFADMNGDGRLQGHPRDVPRGTGKGNFGDP